MQEFFPMFVTQVWQVTLLAVVVWIVTKIFCKRRPHLGHALWLLVLVKCIVPPVFSSSTSVYSWLLKDEKTIPIGIVDEDGPLPKESSEPAFVKGLFPKASQNRVADPGPSVSYKITPTQKPQAAQTPTQSRVAKAFEVPITNVKPSSSVPKVASKPVASMPSEPKQTKAPPLLAEVLAYVESWSWQHWIMFSWSVGSLLCFAVTLVRFMRFRKWILKQEMIQCEDVEIQVNELAAQLKLRRKIRVRVIDAEFGPAIMGLFRPTIILPNSIVADQTTDQLEPILGHELLHLRRGDIYWSVLQVVACSLMWFHPLVWLASRNVTRESEKCCDEETIANFQCDRANYARVLVDILEQKSRLRIAPVVPGVRPADITSSRLERIMQFDNGTCRRTPRWIWALVVLIGVAVIPGAAVVQSQERKVADGTTLPVSNSVLVPNDHLAHDTGTSRPMPPSVPIRSFKVFNGSTVGEQVPVTRKTTSGGGFNINRTPQKSLDEISKLAFTEEEQKKIADEFKDHFWQSCDARRHLQHCENKKVLVKFRYAALPPELAEMLAGDAELSEAASNADWRVSTHQVSLSDLVPILKELRNKKAIVTPPSFTWMFKDDLSSSVGAFIPKAVRMEISHVSMLDPERTTVGKVNLKEGVSVSGSVESIEAASVSLKTNLQFDRAFNGTQRQLPLRTGSGPVEIDVPEVASLVESSSFSLGAGDVQIVRAVRNDAPEVQMFAIISVTNHPAWVKDMQSLTLKSVLGIKKQIEEQSTMPMGSSYALRTRGVLGKVEVMAFPKALKALKAQKELPPMSLLLRCGNPDEVKSLNTQIGLTKDSVLTVEGEVASQQITTDSVQVNGKNFVFKNEEEGSFSAKAASGSLSFNRAGPIEDTLRLSLRSDATLQFAGVEFSADSIECIQDRIEASGNVKVSIPEISSKVSAGRVILNLKSLAFDFDGDVKVERNIDEDSFPFLVKGKHVAWSLVTGEMQTDVRHSNPRRSARQSNAFGNPTFPFNQTRFGESVFQRQESGTRFNAGGPSPVQPNQTQSNSHFRPFNRTSGRN